MVVATIGVSPKQGPNIEGTRFELRSALIIPTTLCAASSLQGSKPPLQLHENSKQRDRDANSKKHADNDAMDRKRATSRGDLEEHRLGLTCAVVLFSSILSRKICNGMWYQWICSAELI